MKSEKLFRFRSKVIVAASVAKIVAAWLLTVLCAVMTFLAEAERERFLWGFGALFCVVSLGILWQFHWMMLNRNAVLRELKRLELVIGERAVSRPAASDAEHR